MQLETRAGTHYWGAQPGPATPKLLLQDPLCSVQIWAVSSGPPYRVCARRGCSQDDPPRTTLPALVLSHSFCSCLACGPGVVRGSVPSVCPEVMLCWAGCLAPGSLEVPGHCEVPRTLTLPKVTSSIHTCGADRQLPLTRRAGDISPTLLASEGLAVRGPASVGSHAQSCIFKRMMSVPFHTRCADMLQGRQIFILRSRISPPSSFFMH